MKLLLLLGGIGVSLVGCVPTTDLIQDGHYTIQLTQSRNIWGQNVVHETRCLNTDKIDGFCAPHKGVSGTSTIVQAPGPEMASAVLSAASILGGAAIISHGIRHQAVPQGTVNRIFPDSRISTFNGDVRYVPIQ